MFTHKDIAYRTVFVINCIKERELKVSNGELLLKDMEAQKTLTKLPFQKILALLVIGHIHVTTPLIDKCKKHNVALVVVKPNFRPTFFWSLSAEANFLLRQKQYVYSTSDISIAKYIVMNKIHNQYMLLANTRQKDELIKTASFLCQETIAIIPKIDDYNQLMGLEGKAAKSFFAAYFDGLNWTGRKPRTKCDAINASLDIGYTLLFNYIEVFVRMFGFDPYVGVYHRLWFKRKSLICDLMEPFRCLIDRTVRKALKLKQIKDSDFNVIKGEYRLKIEMNSVYCELFYSELIKYKGDVFKYMQSYYRCFMQGKSIMSYPYFSL